MSKKQHSPEQIIVHLRQVEVLCNQGQTVAEAARQSEAAVKLPNMPEYLEGI